MDRKTIHDKPQRLRLSGPRGLEFGKVDRDAGMIRDFAVVTRGEATGHQLWLDKTFLDSVRTAGNGRERGIKSRFTHPGLSGDGLGKLLGRATNFHRRGEKVFADLGFVDSAKKTPGGDLAGYVMDLAEETPDLFGASIVFDSDYGAMDKFRANNKNEKGKFVSPDEDNKNNFEHARLADLRAADIVDDPAANPDGMFSFAPGSELAMRAEAILSFALGLTDAPPPEVDFLPHPDRARAFVQEFLARHGLAIQKNTMTLYGSNWGSETQTVEDGWPDDPAPTKIFEARIEVVEDMVARQNQRIEHIIHKLEMAARRRAGK
jgi:hypothetical protein